ncbi:hypothetical protein PAPYR_3342 [Paratrimastix pyriformis]|uniref:Knr4/Smi1-like domain-containing protein n=1 Tax=Paratrimastix pyriformis TaxID=342808 RepID=A0ABQ8UMC7_9EUKA|nr:hypothetical protein PAPYR_3342 [Paratrimastix pyriformis]
MFVEEEAEDDARVEIGGRPTPLVLKKLGPKVSDKTQRLFRKALSFPRLFSRGAFKISAFPVPQDYEEFLTKYNGGFPKVQTITGRDDKPNVPYQSGEMVDAFFWVGSAGAPQLACYELKWNLRRENIPEGSLPIAGDPFGNLYCLVIDEDTDDELPMNAVLFWDHETTKTRVMADSFTDFVNRFQSLDEWEREQARLRAAGRVRILTGPFPKVRPPVSAATPAASCRILPPLCAPEPSKIPPFIRAPFLTSIPHLHAPAWHAQGMQAMVDELHGHYPHLATHLRAAFVRLHDQTGGRSVAVLPRDESLELLRWILFTAEAMPRHPLPQGTVRLPGRRRPRTAKAAGRLPASGGEAAAAGADGNGSAGGGALSIDDLLGHIAARWMLDMRPNPAPPPALLPTMGLGGFSPQSVCEALELLVGRGELVEVPPASGRFRLSDVMRVSLTEALEQPAEAAPVPAPSPSTSSSSLFPSPFSPSPSGSPPPPLSVPGGSMTAATPTPPLPIPVPVPALAASLPVPAIAPPSPAAAPAPGTPPPSLATATPAPQAAPAAPPPSGGMPSRDGVG